MKKLIIASIFVLGMLLSPKNVMAHCEVPCGIYHDELRFQLIDEHIETIGKAMSEVVKLSAEEKINYNQVVRWVNTKEEHAKKIQEIVNQYFLTQRIKIASPDDKEKYDFYMSSLKYLHEMLVFSMKCKQGTDQANVEKLKTSAKAFEDLYMAAHGHKHEK